MVSGATNAMKKTNPDLLIHNRNRMSLSSKMLLHLHSRRSLSSEMLRHWRWIAVAALVTGTIWLLSSFVVLLGGTYMVQVLVQTKALLKDFFIVNELWRTADSNGWRASSAPRTYWPPPPTESESNGYLRVRCNGDLTQQRSAICNAVVVARIMNATLVLPELGTNSFLNDESGFVDIYDVPHFIKTLKFDVRIVMSVPKITEQGKTKKLRAYKIEPPRYASVTWYKTTALEAMRKYGAIYLTPFSQRLEEEIDDPELQRLRCRVNYHALQFKPNIMETSSDIVHKLRSEGHFMSIHLQFELDMLALYGCIDIFTPKDQEILLKYQKEQIAWLAVYPEPKRHTGNCPLTPEEVGLTIRAMGFDNTTRIYIASGELFGGKHLVKPLKAMFPRLEDHTSMVGSGNKLEGLAGSAVDYMVCLLSDIFIPVPTYDDEGHSNLANHLMGHRLYYGFRTTIIPNRKALVPIFNDMKEGHASGYEERTNAHFGGLHKRIYPEYSFYTEGHKSGYEERIRQVMFNTHVESFYANSWPECFCQMKTRNHADRCPPNNVINLESQFQNEEDRSY